VGLKQVEAGVVLGDPDEHVSLTSHHGQFLKVVHIPIDVVGALEVRVGLKLGEGLVLLVLLYEPEAELGRSAHQSATSFDMKDMVNQTSFSCEMFPSAMKASGTSR
jgi:hypothetical protein